MTKHIGKKKNVDFQGSLDVISPDSVFQLIHYTNLTGKLTLLNTPQKATFYLKKGLLVWGALHAPTRQIGQLLVEAEAITPAQLNECLTIHIKAKQQKRLGEILLEKGFLQTDLLHESLKEQVKDAFFQVLDWKHGIFFFISDLISPEEHCTLNERVDHLLLEGIVNIDNKAAEAV